MSDQSSSQQKPVAYDREGRPLYAAPPSYNMDQAEPQFVHLRRSVTPEKQAIPDDIKAKHDESAGQYPSLNLSEAEYVINEVRRHPIGLYIPLGLTIFLVALVLSLIIGYPLIMDSLGMAQPPGYGLIIVGGGLLVALLLLGGYVAAWVYTNNKFFLTNESVIQEIQTSLFARKEQTVSLGNIEDASYQQQGVVQMLFDYGSIRLSTQGDETTYRFSYVVNPKKQIAALNNAVEAFKNGRPVEG